MLLLFADGRPRRPGAAPLAGAATPPRIDRGDRRPTVGEAIALLREPRLRALVIAATVLALATVSDGFVYLGLQRALDLPLTAFPLLFVGAAGVYMALAIPIGRLADRVGRRSVFVAGYALLLPVYAVLLLPDGGTAVPVLTLTLVGAYYAATDGVLQAIASARLPDRLRASGLALLVTATSLAKLVSSVLFGLAWTLGGLEVAVAAFTAALVVALLVATLVLTRSPEAVA